MALATGSDELIVAVATAAGRAGIAIVRLSGAGAAHVAYQLTGTSPQPRRAHYCALRGADGAILERAILLYFPAPHSYTGEETVELQVHGSPILLDLLLQRCTQLGARLAQPGEFTQRAYLNGKLDLAQAEAVADLINASSEQAFRAAQRSLQGEFSRQVTQLAEALTALRVEIEALLDFPEDETALLDTAQSNLNAASATLEQLLRNAQQGALLNSGLQLVLTGAPNVGKSSLLNCLAGQERAIVTAIPGTTRDAVRETIHLAGIPLQITDTAGLRSSSDPLELLGMARSRSELEKADLVLLVVDARDPTSLAQQAAALALPLPPPQRCIVVANKCDLAQLPVQQSVTAAGYSQVTLCARSGEGIELLRQAILDATGASSASAEAVLARPRHLAALHTTAQHLDQARQACRAGTLAATPELYAEELRLAHVSLGQITGTFSSDDLLGEIFSNFCLGK